MAKADLRKTLLQARRSLTQDEWQKKSQQICVQLRSSPLVLQARVILAYFSIRQEPDLSFLWHDATVPSIRWGFPRCVGTTLSWHHWSPHADLERQQGAFGIWEPHPDAPILEPEQVDLMLIPAIACDAQGYRLGYGGGFYDRLLALPAWASKPTIGIVFDFARLPSLPVDPWDRPLTAVCTEAGLFPAEPPAQ